MGLIKCIFVGDLALGDHPKSVGFGFYSTYCEGIPLEKASNLFYEKHSHDILFGNLEFTLGGDILKAKSCEKFNCRGIAQYADFLQQIGFNVVNVANNHIYQYGIEAFNQTLELLSSKGIGIVGLRSKTNTSNVVSIGNQSVCFLGWSARPRQGFSEQPPYYEFDEKSCYEEIAEARSRCLLVCASLHWGDEFIEIPSEEEKRIARKMIDAGASVVVGHHPHVMREIEEYNGGLIAYSLGNFICDMTWNKKTRKTGYLYVEFSDRTISRWEMVAGRISDGYFPEFNRLTADQTPSYKDLYSSLQTRSYIQLAQQEMRHHQLLTGLHMLRNCFNYRPSVWCSMLGGAIKTRLSVIR